MPALWSSHRCTGCSEVLLCSCCMSPRTAKFWHSLFLRCNTKEIYRKNGETLEREETRVIIAPEKMQWVQSGDWVRRQDSRLYGSCRKRAEVFSQLPVAGWNAVFLIWKCCSSDSFHCLQRGRSDYPLFPTSPGAACGKYYWHCGNWDFILYSVKVLLCANDKTPLSLVTL